MHANLVFILKTIKTMCRFRSRGSVCSPVIRPISMSFRFSALPANPATCAPRLNPIRWIRSGSLFSATMSIISIASCRPISCVLAAATAYAGPAAPFSQSTKITFASSCSRTMCDNEPRTPKMK